jgi:hypothetical protein
MIECFTDRADLAPYTELKPSYPLGELNGQTAYGAEESLAMDFSREDATPEIRLNEIIWKSIRGARSEMPRPVHHRSAARGEEEEEGER